MLDVGTCLCLPERGAAPGGGPASPPPTGLTHTPKFRGGDEGEGMAAPRSSRDGRGRHG